MACQLASTRDSCSNRMKPSESESGRPLTLTRKNSATGTTKPIVSPAGFLSRGLGRGAIAGSLFRRPGRHGAGATDDDSTRLLRLQIGRDVILEDQNR